MDALGAARMGDEIAHGAGILGMLAGAVVGAVVAVAVVAVVAATGGLAVVIFAAAIAGGALAANQILKGLKTIFQLPDPTTGMLASGSHNVLTNSRPAARATLDFAAGCSGGCFPFITHPPLPPFIQIPIAEGAKKVTINSMPAARITMQMTCGAFIKTASDNVFIGGPTARTEFVWDITGWLETGFTWLGMAALGGAAILAVLAGTAAVVTLAAAVVVGFAAIEGLGMLGDMIGPGYRDLFQGVAGMGLLFAGPKMAGTPQYNLGRNAQEILALPKGKRPDPSTYLTRPYVDRHLAKFENGASRFMTKSNLEKYGIGQRDGTSFVMPKSEADALMASTKGNPRAMEAALGLPDGFLKTNELVRVDISSPRDSGLRIPSGNEAGANDLWIPGGKLPTGASEAVIDAPKVPARNVLESPVGVK
jgi:uncharacterized Zn-binding protein involved in type VI secretion